MELVEWAAHALEMVMAKVVYTQELAHRPGEGTQARLSYFILEADLKPAIKEVRRGRSSRWQDFAETRAVEASLFCQVVSRMQLTSVHMYVDATEAPRRLSRSKPRGCGRVWARPGPEAALKRRVRDRWLRHDVAQGPGSAQQNCR